ncbi:TetR/AcrR family transcriptional regulator [Bacillus sp. T33-2]|uniref:TetR/AcrR family transcriptional regulator n=1 Tax=Bacillus sp. T33-2 TaxID=2054168 RepID=UPI000C78781E|nr:TetR/AcrR family transcriptional regulator [Bacillus sp. T33-2]PLR89122.1 TetR/AcrR family transcriptional regulator [Bacillus sp. T33-2]
MNDRKQHVIEMAHQLFIDKGFQATSIQDILEYSGISKGTFYNYFSSKNELLIALIKTIYKRMEKDRNELLIGQDPSNIEIFVKQMVLQLKTNRANKLFSLFEEVIFSNDPDLKQFIKEGQLRTLHWLTKRFADIFGETKKPYLLDCAIMFVGILQHNLKYYTLAHGSKASIHKVVHYSVERVVSMVNEVAETGDQLMEPTLLNKWLPECNKTRQTFQKDLNHTVLSMKKTLNHMEEQAKYIELLDFIQDELIHSTNPREYLIKSALSSLDGGQTPFGETDLKELNRLIVRFFQQDQ